VHFLTKKWVILTFECTIFFACCEKIKGLQLFAMLYFSWLQKSAFFKKCTFSVCLKGQSKGGASRLNFSLKNLGTEIFPFIKELKIVPGYFT